MTLDDALADKNPTVFSNIQTNSMELILQSPCARAKVISKAWFDLIFFTLFGSAFTTVACGVAGIILGAALATIAPQFASPWIFWVILGGGYGVLMFWIGRTIWTTGFTTFVFDRIQKKLVINTINLLSQKYVRIIPFAQIQDVRLYDSQKEDPDIHSWGNVSLFLGDRNILGTTYPKTIVVSGFSSTDNSRSQTLKLLQYHQEMCLSVRECLGLNGFQIPKDWLINVEIPTDQQLQQQQSEDVSAAIDSLKGVFKTMLMDKQSKQNQLDLARQSTIESPNDPHTWEQLALLLSCQSNPPMDEVAAAYQRAAILFREKGDEDKAISIFYTLKKLGR